MDAEQDEELKQAGLPDEYLFLHCGCEEPKEVAWCGAADGYFTVTDYNGIQLAKPSNM